MRTRPLSGHAMIPRCWEYGGSTVCNVGDALQVSSTAKRDKKAICSIINNYAFPMYLLQVNG